MDIRNKKLSNDDFFAQRNEVLSQWKTGSEVNFEEAVEYQKSIAPEKRFGNELAKAVENRRSEYTGKKLQKLAELPTFKYDSLKIQSHDNLLMITYQGEWIQAVSEEDAIMAHL